MYIEIMEDLHKLECRGYDCAWCALPFCFWGCIGTER